MPKSKATMTETQLANLRPKYKGSKGNKGAGRPAGSLNTKTIIEKYLKANGTFLNPITKRIEEMPVLDKMILQQIGRAIKKSDTFAFNSLIDRVDGKAGQKLDVDVTSNGESFFDYLKATSVISEQKGSEQI